MRVLLATHLVTVVAMWPHAWIVGYACGRTAQYLLPDCSEIDAACFCNSRVYFASVAHCINKHTFGNATAMGAAWDRFELSYCYLQDSLPAEDDIFLANSLEANGTVPESTYVRAYWGQYNNLEQKDRSVRLGCGITLYWLLIMLVAALHRGFLKFAITFGDRRFVMRRPPVWYRWLQRKFYWPALIRTRHMQRIRFRWFSFSLGTRFESAVILGHIFLSMVFMLAPYTFMDHDPYFESRWKEMMRYASDRSGIIAVIHMPLYVLFAMRNNVLIWLTGWSFSAFNVYHRAVGRVTFVLIIIHAVTKHIFSASYGASLVKYFYPLAYYRWGVAATGLMAVMVFLGSLRERFYELFLYSHIVCAIGAMVCSIKHLDGIGYQQPLYICFGIWGADIILRVARILVFNFGLLLPPLSGSQRLTYGIAKVFDYNAVNITVRLPIRWRVTPGQYIYLHLSRWGFLGGHPFSVLGRSVHGEGLEILCRARGGLTQRLKDQLIKIGCTDSTEITLPLYIEGPYGVSAPIERYDEALVFAGGVGITGVLPYVERLCSASRATEHHLDRAYNRIVLIWTVPRRSDFAPVVRRLLELRNTGKVDIQLYCRTSSIPISALADLKVGFVHDHSSITNSGTESTRLDRGHMRAHSTMSTRGLEQNSSEETLAPLPRKSSKQNKHTRMPTSLYLNAMGDSVEQELPTICLVNRHARMDDTKLNDAGFLDPLNPTFYSGDVITDAHFYREFVAKEERSNLDDIQELIHLTRPDVAQLTRQFFLSSQGSVAVIACGPAPMMDAVCQAVCEHAELVAYGRTDYFEEAFSW